MLIALLGPPGAGKGTQAEQIVSRYNLPHISTGNILRSAVKNGTELGKRAKGFMEKGELVSDEIVVGIIKERLKEPDCHEGSLLDGFPRTVQQARVLDEVLDDLGKQMDAVIYIDVSEEEIVARLTGRRACRDCGASYHQKFNPPQVRNVCDQCSGELYQREDDAFETVVQRIKVYQEQTMPLIKYYRKKEILKSVDGNKDILAVFEQIKVFLDNF